MGLMIGAGGLFIALLWLNLLYMDEFASKFILSDNVMTIHRLTSGLLFLQLIMMLALIFALERAIAKKNKTEKAEPSPGTLPHDPVGRSDV
jgi:hypothetical protein